MKMKQQCQPLDSDSGCQPDRPVWILFTLSLSVDACNGYDYMGSKLVNSELERK
jgi:hypothetical protein